MSSETVLHARSLTIDLFTKSGALRPVDGVSYSVGRGETLAIVGESSSGKTVMSFAPFGLMPMGVEVGLSGSLIFEGAELVGASRGTLRGLAGRKVGVIFQDPMSALNPARRIGRQIAESAEMHLGLTTQQAEARALDMMKLVGISDPAARMRQYPHELSGGLCQRAVIAAAVISEPSLLIADEPTTALDVTIQAQILTVLKDIQTRLGMAMVLITHDIGVVAGCADRVAVMYAGRIAEQGGAEDVLLNPAHPYTRGLIAAIPRPDDAIGSHFRGLPGLPPVLEGPVEGCAFAPRCNRSLPPCRARRPPLWRDPAAPRVAFCHALALEPA